MPKKARLTGVPGPAPAPRPDDSAAPPAPALARDASKPTRQAAGASPVHSLPVGFALSTVPVGFTTANFNLQGRAGARAGASAIWL
jgi:hypothetical protein